MRSIVVAALFAAVPLLLDAQCVTNGDLPVAPVRYAPTCGHSVAKIAANGAGAFALWSNTHAGFSMVTYWMSGTILDGAGMPRRLAEHTYETGPYTAELATDGVDYLMAWASGGSAHARVIGADGTSGDSVVLATGLPAEAEVRNAWNGRAYVVAAGTQWSLVSTTGRVLDSATLDVQAIALAMPADGRVLAITTAMQAVIVDGLVAGMPVALPIPADATDVAVARGTDGFLAVWRSGGAIFAHRLDASGAPIGETRTIATTANRATVIGEDGNDLVLWSDASGVKAARVASDGVVSPAFAISGGALAAAAFNGNATIVLSQTLCGSIQSSAIPRGGSPSAASDVSLAAIAQTTPQIVATPSGHQLFWAEDAGLMTAFAGKDGTIGAAERVNAPSSDISRYVTARTVETTYVFWTDYPGGRLPGTLRAARFDDAGQRIDEFEIRSAWFLFGLSAASDGRNATIAWTENTSSNATFSVVAARVAGGAVVVPATTISRPGEVMYEVIAAADAASSLIVWRDDADTLISVQLDSDLRPLLRRDVIPSTTGVIFPLGAAIDGSRSLITWFSGESDGVVRLRASANSLPDSILSANVTGYTRAAIQPRGDGWIIDFLAFDQPNGTRVLERSTLSGDLSVSGTARLACAPGDFDYTLAGDRVDFMLIAAPQAENEGAPRVLIRRPPQPRRRAAR